MLDILFNEGFIFFDGMALPDKDLKYLTDLSNYSIGNYHGGMFKRLSPLQESTQRNINNSFPTSVKEFISSFKISWGGIAAEKGFCLSPHNDSLIRSGGKNIVPGPALVVFWICPNDFEGREFVWGKVKDFDKTETSYTYEGERNAYSWDDPNLEFLGKIKPKTGSGVIIDRTNPIWFHAVSELLTDTCVFSISGSL